VRTNTFPEIGGAVTVSSTTAIAGAYEETTFKNGADFVGVYSVAVGTAAAIYAPNQTINNDTAETNQNKVVSGGNAFWETVNTQKGGFASPGAVAGGTTKTLIDGANPTGLLTSACTKTVGVNPAVLCKAIGSNIVDSSAVKAAPVLGRIVFASKAGTGDVTITTAPTGKNLIKPVVSNSDLILASLYQSNDTSGTGSNTKWCVGAWSNSLASDVSVKITDGLNGKTKCTFQFIASSNTKAPAFELSGGVLDFGFLIQAVEWTDLASVNSFATFNSW